MTLKRQQFAEGEIPIFEEVCICERRECLQFDMWLSKENSLCARNEANALKEAKRQCRGFGFAAGVLKGSLAKGR